MKTIGVEIGGTFTDFIMVDGGTITTLKIPSTPADPALAVFTGLDELGVDLKDIDSLRHGSTVATNRVLERKGASVAFVTTEGFRDILEFQRELRDRNYDIYYQKPTPLVRRDSVLQVPERVGPQGQDWRPLDIEDVTRRIDSFFSDRDVDAAAICLLHSYVDPSNERRVKQIIGERYPGMHVVASSEILPEFREYERASTTVISAFVGPIVDRYISSIEKGLAERRFDGDFHIMQSNGGNLPSTLARRHGARTIMSGPAAGVIGATRVATQAGIENIITVDMGGTSTDVCLTSRGRPAITTEASIGGLPIRLPMIDIATVGAGGGSIAWMDPGKMLRVGPQSAGADPGPACYGKGGQEPTVTDAYLVKGLVRPGTFLGGKMKLHADRANQVIDPLAKCLGLSRLEMADAIYRIATANMAFAMRLVSVERGHDPRDYTLLAFGGAGGLHATYLADELGTDVVLIPPTPGLLSAYGLLVAKFQRDYVQTDIGPASESASGRVVEILAALEERAGEELASHPLDIEGLSREWSIDMRYKGQAYELNVPVDKEALESDGLGDALNVFHSSHKRRYGHASPDKEVELVNYRLAVFASGADSDVQMPVLPTGEPVRTQGSIHLDGEQMACDFFSRMTLPIGFELEGPAVVEEDTATTLVSPGWTGVVDEFGNIRLQRGGHHAH